MTLSPCNKEILENATDITNLAHEGFHKMADGHARGDGMGVDDKVGHNTLRCPGHILLGVCHAYGALLPVPTGKLVAHLRHSDGPHLHARKQHYYFNDSPERAY